MPTGPTLWTVAGRSIGRPKRLLSPDRRLRRHPTEIDGGLIVKISCGYEHESTSRYRLRKQIVEPVFGQIKQARGFRQFLLRGIEKVKAEWTLICTAHNLTKLASAA